MRMRKKSNLETRMTQHPDYLLLNEIGFFDGKYTGEQVKKEEIKKFNLKEIFGNDNPVYLEIGCGKGGFAVQFAQQNPNINILALEVISNVIIVGMEKAEELKIPNLKFINCRAEHLTTYFDDAVFDRIFLNFSCPYPKNTYANRRLTAPAFLEVYKKVLKKGCEIHQKTDNQKLFEFSIENLSRAGFMLKNVSLDLHKSSFEGNIVTEYEQKFVSQGLPIYRLEAQY